MKVCLVLMSGMEKDSPCWRWAPIFSPSASKKVVLVGWGMSGWLVWKVRGSTIVLEGGLGGGGQLLGWVLKLTDERDDGQILPQQL